MNPFWRDTPLTDPESLLMRAVFDAHAQSAFRENCSTQALMQAASGSNSLPNALIAALSTLGERHAPLVQTYEFLQHAGPGWQIPQMLEDGKKVPGWGNSFHQEPDPLWEEVNIILLEHFPLMHSRIASVTAALHANGKPLQPNPSTFTAATAILLGMPKEVSPYLFIGGRLLSWSVLFLRATK